MVDDKHKLIVYSEATTDGNDRQQLKKMVQAVEQEYGQRPELVRADADYFNTKDIKEVEEAGTKCYCNIPKNAERIAKKDGQGQAIEFIYDEQKDEYKCSHNGRLVRRRYEPNKGGRGATRYQGVDCRQCPARSFCTTSKKGRTLYRYDDEEWKEQYIKRMKSPSGKLQAQKRKANVEHPYGTIKMVFMDRMQLKMRGKYKVQTEICLYHFAYNFKRMQKITTFQQMMKKIQEFDFNMLQNEKQKAA